MLDAPSELGLKLPSSDYDTANEKVKRGYDNLVAYYESNRYDRKIATISQHLPSQRMKKFPAWQMP
jgi:hypothetical protein